MDKDSLFAVVDIETTGTDQKKDKIFQFACVFVQHGKIVNQVSIDINPLRTIPKHIVNLTGVTNKDVSNSPYFEDVAYSIRQMIDNCVFVAHNVFFDYHFLNSELERAGVPKLKVECIDTVELAQVFYPTANGFRVSDLARHINMPHENPHQALSDALATSMLLIDILKKGRSYPLVTLEVMSKLSKHLGVNNDSFFKLLLDIRKADKDSKLLEEIKIIDGIALREKDRTYLDINSDITDFNVDLSENKLRESQKNMSSSISDFISKTNTTKNLMIEAETGIGKTLGYLYPLVQNNKKRILISTSTILLQEQILKKDVPLLNEITNKNYLAVLLKSKSHYLNLAAFKRSLSRDHDQKHYVICQMATLSWLLVTKTGDLDEINVMKQNLFYNNVAHRGIQVLKKDSPFYGEDFLIYLYERAKHADFIVVNHSYLLLDQMRKVKELLPAEYVVIDEAHRLSDVLEQTKTSDISFKQLQFYLKQILQFKSTHKNEVEQIVKMCLTVASELKETIEAIELGLIQHYWTQQTDMEQSLDISCLLKEKPTLKQNIREVRVLIRELAQIIIELDKEELILDKEEISSYLDKLVVKGEELVYFFSYGEPNEIRWLKFHKQHLILSLVDVSALSLESYDWYNQAKKIIYTSGTLQLDSESTYFEKRLQLESLEKKKIPSVYNYKEQARFYVVKPKENDTSQRVNEAADRIVKSTMGLYKAHKRSILVLFTSHKLLRAVYEKLTKRVSVYPVQILAQGITGTKEKMIKKIQQGGTSIILGANSFWEGVDFEGASVDIIVMTKLPFDVPERPLIQARYSYLEEQGENPFYVDALPQAGVRLRQGMGRLLRSPIDKGILVMLDERILEKSYSNKLLSYLPQELEIHYLELEEVLLESKEFINTPL